MTTELESGVGNCFPGLEVDLRNLDRRFFPYLTFDFLGDQVVELAGSSLGRAEAEQPPGPLVDGIRRSGGTEQGPWRVTRVTGDFAGFGSRTFQADQLGEVRRRAARPMLDRESACSDRPPSSDAGACGAAGGRTR